MKTLLTLAFVVLFSTPALAADPMPSPAEVCSKVIALLRAEAPDVKDDETKSLHADCLTEVDGWPADVKAKTITCIMAAKTLDEFSLCEPK